MAEQLSPARVVELVKMAKAMTPEEINVLVAAFGLEIAQDFAIETVKVMADEYVGQGKLPGMDMIEPAARRLEYWFGEQDLYEVNDKYRLGDFFDVHLETKLVATPRKV